MWTVSTAPRSLRGIWLLAWAVPAALQLIGSLALPRMGIWQSPNILFVFVLLTAIPCVVFALVLLRRSMKRNEPELGYTALFFLSVSVLPLVHGVTTPGVLYDENTATTAAAFWAIPVALIVALPLFVHAKAAEVSDSRFFRRWTAAALATLAIIATVLLAAPKLVSFPASGSAAAIAIACGSFIGCVVLSRRHLYLADVAGNAGPLTIAAGYGFVGASAFVWFGTALFSTGFWLAHVLDALGVLSATVGALVMFGKSKDVRSVVNPILVADPTAALELGLDATVHRFVADLEAKDRVTRDHVIRTAELAIKVGHELKLSATELRDVGLAALLHDIGKLDVPDEILTKPGSLTDGEYATMKNHALWGSQIVETSPALRRIAPAVRNHHERVDGGGYPDGLVGEQIPLAARMVAVCDAFDAMANTRHYRDGMGADRAVAILREHAGAQWDQRVVDAAIRVIDRTPVPSEPVRLEAIGRVGCDCLPEALVA